MFSCFEHGKKVKSPREKKQIKVEFRAFLGLIFRANPEAKKPHLATLLLQELLAAVTGVSQRDDVGGQLIFHFRKRKE